MPRKPKQPNRKKHTHLELTALRDTFLRQLYAQHTPDADRTLDIYKSMRAVEDGEARTSLSQQIEVLGCRQWQQMLRCQITGKSAKQNIKVCRRRFLCLNCHKWKLQAQVERWHMAVKQMLRRQDSWLGPLVQLKWNLPQKDPRASLGSFDRFIEKTFTAWLADQGIPPDQWMICRTFDPIQCAARLVYAGPPIFSELSLRIYKHIPPLPPSGTIRNKSEIIPPLDRGRPCPWWDTVSESGEAYLLNYDNPAAGESDCFDRTLRNCLFWCVGNTEDLLHLQREQVWRIYVKYNHTRMFSVRGLLSGANDARIHRFLHPQDHDPTILVDKQHRDGTIEPVLRDSIKLLGADSALTDEEMLAGQKLCPLCGNPENSPGHDLDAEPTTECKEKAGDEDYPPPAKKFIN
jgi:hypothetical protein